jgi:hypothetical protein
MASTSATNASSPIDLKELDDLLSWNPPRLVLRPRVDNRKPATTTGPPAFFDRHFSRKLALKQVVRLPSLVEDLAKSVDLALEKHALPELSGLFPTAAKRMEVAQKLEPYVRDEKGVCQIYSRTTGDYCPIVASTLTLNPKAPGWIPLIRWTEAVSRTRHAIMDAELTFYAPADTEFGQRREEVIKTMESGRRRILEAMRKTQSPLMTFEFKSLSAGPAEVMTAVPELGKFKWSYCGSPDHPCSDPKHKNVRDEVVAISPGLDALHPPWNLPMC